MIDGVKILNPKSFVDDRGFFKEIFRFHEQFENIPLGQLSHSMVMQGVIKGWHGHVYQSQWNYVISGVIEIVLFDDRKDSRTFGEIIELRSGDGGSQIAYFFPPGVLHGYKCLEGPMHIIYITSGTYDLQDEVRHKYNYTTRLNGLYGNWNF